MGDPVHPVFAVAHDISLSFTPLARISYLLLPLSLSELLVAPYYEIFPVIRGFEEITPYWLRNTGTFVQTHPFDDCQQYSFAGGIIALVWSVKVANMNNCYEYEIFLLI